VPRQEDQKRLFDARIFLKHYPRQVSKSLLTDLRLCIQARHHCRLPGLGFSSGVFTVQDERMLSHAVQQPLLRCC